MNEYNINIGIDVAKNHLDVCILPSGKTKRFRNNELGIISLIEFIGNKEQVERIILEPTGGYEELVLEMLSEKHYKISLVNAAQIRAFAKANGILAKTDKIDAFFISLFFKICLVYLGSEFHFIQDCNNG